jgi:23S rRNA pseudouridine2605 synthase
MKNPQKDNGGLVRLQKLMAEAGVGSRRYCEELIVEGRVKVNGKQVTELGSKFSPINLQLEVDGQSFEISNHKLYIAFYKPRGILSSMGDPQGRPNLDDYFSLSGKYGSLLPSANERLFHVGRLDMESEGLLLLTNDGDFAFKATHPTFGVLKKYVVEVEGELAPGLKEKWLKGIKLEDGIARAKKFTVIRSQTPKHHWLEIEIEEGRNHIIRRMCESSELLVERLIRTQFGVIDLGELPEGRYRHLSEQEVESLLSHL